MLFFYVLGFKRVQRIQDSRGFKRIEDSRGLFYGILRCQFFIII
nr:MAG TPA: hypothetical protein [Caudoviricetes sp.]